MNFRIILVSAAIVASSVACDNDDNDPPSNDDDRTMTEQATALLNIEMVANEMEYIARQTVTRETHYSNGSTFMNCANITRTDTPTGELIELQFQGSTACVDGKTRSGKVKVEFIENDNATFIQLEKYTIDNVQIEGGYVFQHITEQQTALFKLIVQNGKLTSQAGKFINYSLTRKTAFKAGESTTVVNDDEIETVESEYFLTGNEVGMVDAVVKTPLLLKYACDKWFVPVAGKIEYETATTSKGTLIFGDGNCDGEPTVETVP